MWVFCPGSMTDCLMLARNTAAPVYPLLAADRNLKREEIRMVCACNADQIECPWVPYCKGPGSTSGPAQWCCVDHEHAQITGHILVTFKWELAGKLSFSIFQEKYDNQIEAHAIFNAPLSILVAPASLSAAASSLTRSAGGGPVCLPLPVTQLRVYKPMV